MVPTVWTSISITKVERVKKGQLLCYEMVGRAQCLGSLMWEISSETAAWRIYKGN